MPTYKFVKRTDIEIDADDPMVAYQFLEDECEVHKEVLGNPEEYEFFGLAYPEGIQPELLEAVDKIPGFTLMTVQYRGENFACLCKVKDIDEKYVSVKPVALMLTEDQKEYLTDIKGNRPETGLRKKLGL